MQEFERSRRRWAAAVSIVGMGLTTSIWGVGPAAAHDELTRITFGELESQPADGLRLEGVRFGFRVGGVASDDATFNAGGPGAIRFVQDPSLEGDAAGVLTMRFAEETDILRFGVAVSCFDCVLRPGVTVRLFDDGDLVRVARLTTRPLVSFSEARFAHDGEEVTRAVIRFNHSFSPFARFALDNLVFEGDDEDERPDDTGFAPARRAAWQH